MGLISRKVHPTTGATRSCDWFSASQTLPWRATRTLSKLLRNSLLSACVSWTLALCISRGNVLFGQAPEQQPYAAFLAVKVLWFNVFFWVFALATSVCRLRPERFAKHPTQDTLKSRQLLRKLLRPVLPYAVGIALVSTGGSLALVWPSLMVRESKADLYWTLLCGTVLVAVVDLHSRHIYRTQTVSGLARALRRPQRSQRTCGPSRRSPTGADFWRVFRQDLPFMVSALLSAVYVHVVSYLSITSDSQLAFFALCSLALKLVMQEAAKLHLSRRCKTPSTRTMATVVSAPAIMIDTQLRTSLLCQENTSITFVGSVLLAAGEVCIRVVRTYLVRWRTQRMLSDKPTGSSSGPSPVIVHSAKEFNRAASFSSSSSEIVRVHRVLALHAAEVYADMYAEYIAMGCSYAILIFFGPHKRFNVNGRDGANVIDDASTIGGVHLAAMALQVGIEVVVDWVASVLELSYGVDFESFNQDNVFLALFTTGVAVANVHISSGIYLRPH